MSYSTERTGNDLTDSAAGVLNLAENCMRVKPGERILLVLEPEGEDFYDPGLGDLIASVFNKIGTRVEFLRPRIISDPEDFPEDLAIAMGNTDHTLFLSRVGDYLRFTPMMGTGKVTICYARQLATLASKFATLNHDLLSGLLAKLENELMNADRWRITCDLGTDVSGSFGWSSRRGGVDDDFSMTLFPVTTFKPVPGNTANGKIALSRWLMPGAAVKVEPSSVYFDQPVIAEVEHGVLKDLTGDPDSVCKVNNYMNHVCDSLGIQQKNIHSWHAGINPFTTFTADVDSNLMSWGAISFGSPRYLHFHTTGEKPPGEIAWSIFNPSVYIDDTCFWKNGEFIWLQREDNLALLDQEPNGHLLLNKSADIGV